MDNINAKFFLIFDLEYTCFKVSDTTSNSNKLLFELDISSAS